MPRQKCIIFNHHVGFPKVIRGVSSFLHLKRYFGLQCSITKWRLSNQKSTQENSNHARKSHTVLVALCSKYANCSEHRRRARRHTQNLSPNPEFIFQSWPGVAAFISVRWDSRLCNFTSDSKLPWALERFFAGGGSRGFFQEQPKRFFSSGETVLKFHFTHSKLREQPFFIKI